MKLRVDETDERVDDTLSSLSFYDSPKNPLSGSASNPNNFSDYDEIDAIPRSTPNVCRTKLVRRGARTRDVSRSGSASSSGKTQSICHPWKDRVDNG